MSLRTLALQISWIATAFYAGALFDVRAGAAASLVETASGPQGSGGIYAGDDIWLMHRFQITHTTQLTAIGGNFQSFQTTPLDMFGAVVSLTGPADFPDTNTLSTADRLGTTVLTVPQTGIGGQDVLGAIDLTLAPGWYAMVFGTDGFGAGSAPDFQLTMPEFAVDHAHTQLPASLLQPDHPTQPNARIYQLLSPRFLATSGPPLRQSTTLTPYVDAVARLQDGEFNVTDGETSIGTQYFPIAAVDRRGILEFDFSQIPRGSTISSVELELNVSSITHNSLDEYPSPHIYGYTGDGNVTSADALETGNLLLETDPITHLGIQTFALDPEFFETQVTLQNYGGLLIRGSENGRQMQFRTSEFASSPPRLHINFTPPETALPALGDYNGNGYPDTSDYTIWRNTLNSTSDRRADGNNDGVVDADDYAVWGKAYSAASRGLRNGDFATGDLAGWKKVATDNADISAGFPLVEEFDVDGDGQPDPAMRIRVGQVTFDSANPSGGGIEQKFILETPGHYSLSTLFASTNLDTTGNSGPGRFELYFDDVLVDFENLNGTLINPGQVLRGSLQSTLMYVQPGYHTVKLLYLRSATNTRAIYGYFDSVSLSLSEGLAAAVPEPATGMLAAWGSILAMFVRSARRRR